MYTHEQKNTYEKREHCLSISTYHFMHLSTWNWTSFTSLLCFAWTSLPLPPSRYNFFQLPFIYEIGILRCADLLFSSIETQWETKHKLDINFSVIWCFQTGWVESFLAGFTCWYVNYNYNLRTHCVTVLSPQEKKRGMEKEFQ